MTFSLKLPKINTALPNRRILQAKGTPIKLKGEMTLSNGNTVYRRDGIAYEKQLLSDGRVKITNLDTGDVVVGKYQLGTSNNVM